MGAGVSSLYVPRMYRGVTCVEAFAPWSRWRVLSVRVPLGAWSTSIVAAPAHAVLSLSLALVGVSSWRVRLSVRSSQWERFGGVRLLVLSSRYRLEVLRCNPCALHLDVV